jgi:hypothetical protein
MHLGNLSVNTAVMKNSYTCRHKSGVVMGTEVSGWQPRRVFQINQSFGDRLRLHNQSLHQITKRDEGDGIRVGLRNIVGLNHLTQLSA